MAARHGVRLGRGLHRLGLERSGRLAVMAAPFARPQRRRDLEGRVLHAERLENVLPEMGLERLAADRLDDAADPIDAGAVLPALARIEHQWRTRQLEPF